MIGIGVAVVRRASRGLDSYFLAGNELPWYILGVSNASAMFDITGTMWLGLCMCGIPAASSLARNCATFTFCSSRSTEDALRWRMEVHSRFPFQRSRSIVRTPLPA